MFISTLVALRSLGRDRFVNAGSTDQASYAQFSGKHDTPDLCNDRALEAGGMTKNTLIIVSSDNGSESPWKRRTEQHQALQQRAVS